MITVTIDTSDLTRKLADFPAALARAQKQALEDIGAAVASRAERAFKTERLRPSPWAPRKVTGVGFFKMLRALAALDPNARGYKKKKKAIEKAYAKKKGLDHPLLIKHPTGGLWKSISYRLEGEDTVVIGSDKEYATYHQFGTKNMPARPFFPIDKNGRLLPEMASKITRMVKKAYKAAIREVFGNGGG